jgi:rhamnosyltransferase subunit B
LPQPAIPALRTADMAPKFVFSGTGTRGDLIPMLAIASEMLRRGHACHVLANEPSGDTARKFGVPFTSTAPAQLNNLTGVERAFGNHVFPSYRANFAFIEAELARGTELVIVNTEYYAGSTLMAERHRLPLCRLTLAPFRIFSMVQPFYPLSEKVHGPLAQTYRRYVLPRLREQRYSHPYILSGFNAFRAELGLASIESMRELDRLVSYQVCMFPEWYCAPASDWPQALQCVGFPLPQAHGELPDALSRFIGEYGAPIVFTPGTGVSDVAQFFEAARQCCLQLGRPAVFLSSNLAMKNGPSDGPIYTLDYIDLALVLRRAALLVHHGGIGTTARALEAGVPQIISPQAFDQPDNGSRTSRLGVGAMIPRAKLSALSLAGVARGLLENAAIQPVLREVSRRVRGNDGIAGAADVLERQFLAGRASRASSRSAA